MTTALWLCHAPSGLKNHFRPIPRALPWAGMSRAVGAADMLSAAIRDICSSLPSRLCRTCRNCRRQSTPPNPGNPEIYVAIYEPALRDIRAIRSFPISHSRPFVHSRSHPAFSLQPAGSLRLSATLSARAVDKFHPGWYIHAVANGIMVPFWVA